MKPVAGAVPYTRYGWLKRRIMRRLMARANGDTDTTRDYEYTDWEDLNSFARGFARQAESAIPGALASAGSR